MKSLIAGPLEQGRRLVLEEDDAPQKGREPERRERGWYLRTTTACGTGNNPTMVVERMNPSIASSSTSIVRPAMSSSIAARDDATISIIVDKGSSALTLRNHSAEGKKAGYQGRPLVMELPPHSAYVPRPSSEPLVAPLDGRSNSSPGKVNLSRASKTLFLRTIARSNDYCPRTGTG